MRWTGTFLVALSLAGALVSSGRADEIDDILALKAHNRNRLRHFAAEFSVETHQPESVPNAKTVRMRYRMALDRISPKVGTSPLASWRMEMTILEPAGLSIRVEGERVWTQGPDGGWKEVSLPATTLDILRKTTVGFVGQDPADQRRQLAMRIAGRRRSFWGPNTVTLESVPTSRQRLFERMEEDIGDDGLGLVLATRLYEGAGQVTINTRVTRHRRVNGLSVAEEMEAVTQTPLGNVVSRTTCSNIQVDVQP